MAMRVVTMLGLTAGLATAANAGAAEPLPPSSKWQVDYGDKSCIAARVFGTGKQGVTLLLEQFAPGETFRLSLFGNRFRYWSESRDKKLRFGPELAWQDLDFFLGKHGEVPAVFARSSLRLSPWTPEELKLVEKNPQFEKPPVTKGQQAAIRTVDIGRGGDSFQLTTGRLDFVFAELDKCLGTVVKAWGFDPQIMAQLKSRPKARPTKSAWITSDDYPTTAIVRGQRGLVSARLNIDPTGKVTACEILQSTGAVDFEKAVCAALLKRAQFDPAIGPDGKPVAAYVLQSATFQM